MALTCGSLSAPWDTRMYSTSFERSTNFLQHKILKEWIAALLKWSMLCQSTFILLHKMAFQPFWLHLTVYWISFSDQSFHFLITYVMPTAKWPFWDPIKPLNLKTKKLRKIAILFNLDHFPTLKLIWTESLLPNEIEF